MEPLRYLVPPAKSWRDITAALTRASYGVELLAGRRFRALFLDTHDGRLRRAGWRLSIETQDLDDRWRLEGAGEETAGAFSGDKGAHVLPANTFDLPASAAPVVAQRALIALVAARISHRGCTLACPSGSRLALALESFTPLPARGTAEGVPRIKLLTLSFVEGESASLLHAGSYLRDRLGLKPEERDLVGLVLRALGKPEPGAPVPESLRFRREDVLGLAARKIVGQQALKMRASVEGTLEDLDPEFLHDLRVATRRLRSALRLFGEAMSARRADSLRMELAWIGRLLGAVRDLDVFIANLRTQSSRLGDAGAIAAVLAKELEGRRAPAKESLDEALRGRRFGRLLERLDSLAASPVPRTLRGMAAQRVDAAGPFLMGRAQRRVLKLGRSVTDKTEPPVLHRLRILFKRLRYACEFFRDAFGEELEPYIRAMVRFQDCLGEHQDAIVAMVRIRELAADMERRGLIPANALLDLGSLLQVQREIATEKRRGLSKLWATFDKPSVRKVLRKLAREAGGHAILQPPETIPRGLP